jgi:signal transduction histidine kinase
MLRRARELPPRSAIFYALLLVDAAGVPHSLQTALIDLHAAASAPIFGLFDHQLGRGIVGGPLVSIAEASHLSAQVAARVLAGEAPSANRLPPLGPGLPTFDWRELRRWGIRERTLPPGSTVLFRPLSAWSLYRWEIVGALALITLLAGLVVGLVVSGARRRRAELEVRALSRRLLTASEEERRWLARELHDDLAQRLARLAIDAARIERGEATAAGGVDLASMRTEIGSLSSDVHALSRRLHPIVLDDLGLEEALRAEAERFGASESIAVSLQLEELHGELAPDIALCLYRIAQEAMRNVARHARADRVEISLRLEQGGCALEVRDNGVGFDPQAERSGPGLGHVSMRERVQLVGGRLAIRSATGRGTAVRAWVPLETGGA